MLLHLAARTSVALTRQTQMARQVSSGALCIPSKGNEWDQTQNNRYRLTSSFWVSESKEVHMLGIVAIVQLIIHYLGWLGIILGIVAFIFGNRERALELVGGGFGFIVLKYVIGFVFVGLFKLGRKADQSESVD